MPPFLKQPHVLPTPPFSWEKSKHFPCLQFVLFSALHVCSELPIRKPSGKCGDFLRILFEGQVVTTVNQTE